MDHGDDGRAGELLRDYRRAARLTQRQLADTARVSIGVVRDLEQGLTARPRAESVRRLAGALGLGQGLAAEFVRAMTGEAEAAPGAGRAGSAVGLRLGVLGPLTARRDGIPVTLGAGRQRAVLGLQALQPGRLIRREAIIDALWGDDPPTTTVAMVQCYISRLRHLLDPGRSASARDGLLISADTSYRLQLAATELDQLAFGEMTARAQAAHAAGELAAACDLYFRALGMWRGEPLADIDVLRVHPAVTSLGRRWADAVVKCAEAATAAGWHDRVLPQLRELTCREPLDERAHALLMIALAGSGRQAAGLRVYDEVRRRLDDQLGVLPCAELAEAYQRVLRQELPRAAVNAASEAVLAVPPRRAARPRPVAPPARALVVPRQLPAAVPGFAGRAGELKELSALLELAGAATVVISAIDGTAGVGKTALAVHWAHQVAERFPDGQLYQNLRGFDPSGRPMTPAEAIRSLLDALDVPAGRIPASLDATVGLYRSLLAGKRMLVVLDNARDAGQVRPLLPGGPACLTVVTSRSQLTSLVAAEGARSLTLDVLTDAEAREFLARRLGPGRVAARPAVVNELTELCARLPLALSIAAARAAARPAVPLATLVADLRDARGRLNVLDSGDAVTDVRAVFSWSYRQLSAPAAGMFRLLGMHPGPDISGMAAASLAGVPRERARAALRELAEAHLVTEHAASRFAFHDLLRAYAAERAEAHDSDARRRAATHRALDHYLHTAHAAALLLYPAREPLALVPPRPGVVPEDLADHAQALAWCDAEHRVLLAAIAQAADAGFDTHAWQIPWSLVPYLDRRGYAHDYAATQRTALAAALRLDDPAAQACAHRYLGRARALLGGYDDARAHLRHALGLHRQLGDRVGQARAHDSLAWAFGQQARHGEALGHALQAEELFRSAGYRPGQAGALNSVGWYHALLGDHEQALACCQRALVLNREAGYRLGEAETWDSLGYAHHHLGHHAEAFACYRQALDLYREVGDRYEEAATLGRLGDAQRAVGDLEAARDAWQQALTILDDLGRPAADVVRGKLRDLDSAGQ